MTTTIIISMSVNPRIERCLAVMTESTSTLHAIEEIAAGERFERPIFRDDPRV